MCEKLMNYWIFELNLSVITHLGISRFRKTRATQKTRATEKPKNPKTQKSKKPKNPKNPKTQKPKNPKTLLSCRAFMKFRFILPSHLPILSFAFMPLIYLSIHIGV